MSCVYDNGQLRWVLSTPAFPVAMSLYYVLDSLCPFHCYLYLTLLVWWWGVSAHFLTLWLSLSLRQVLNHGSMLFTNVPTSSSHGKLAVAHIYPLHWSKAFLFLFPYASYSGFPPVPSSYRFCCPFHHGLRLLFLRETEKIEPGRAVQWLLFPAQTSTLGKFSQAFPWSSLWAPGGVLRGNPERGFNPPLSLQPQSFIVSFKPLLGLQKLIKTWSLNILTNKWVFGGVCPR